MLVVSGLTGGALTFREEIDEILNPELGTEAGPGLSLAEIMSAAYAEYPRDSGSWRLEYPHSAASTYVVWYFSDDIFSDTLEPLQIWIDPRTAEVVSKRYRGEYLTSWLYRLHSTWLLGDTGMMLIGCMGLLVLVSLSTGVYLWWPPRGRFRQAFLFRRGGSTGYELHRLGGIYALVVLLAIVVSGISMALPQYVKPVVNRISPLSQVSDVCFSEPSSSIQLTPDRVVEIARSVLPEGVPKYLFFPHGAEGCYQVTLRTPDDPNVHHPHTHLWIDPYSGRILRKRLLAENSGGDTFIQWMYPLHGGEAFGLPGRLLILLVGMVPLLLLVTGIRHWLRRRRRF